MKNKLFLFPMLFIFLNSCNKKIRNKVNFSQEIVKENTVIDISNIIKFDKKSDEIKIIDTDYFSEISNFLIQTQREGEILIQSNHGERLLLNTHYSYGKSIMECLIKKGVSSEKISTKIGFDFGEKYSARFSKSRIILIII